MRQALHQSAKFRIGRPELLSVPKVIAEAAAHFVECELLFVYIGRFLEEIGRVRL